MNIEGMEIVVCNECGVILAKDKLNIKKIIVIREGERETARAYICPVCKSDMLCSEW